MSSLKKKKPRWERRSGENITRTGAGLDKSEYRGTPLHSAAGRGFKGMVKVPLVRDDVSPSKLCKIGRRPLHTAAWGGREAGVKKPLGGGNLSPYKPDGYS